jgi:hypothetical protein
MFWKALTSKVKISHAGFLFMIVAQFYLVLGFTGNRFWFMAVPLATLAFGCFIRDAFFEGKLPPCRQQKNIIMYVAAVFFIVAVVSVRKHEIAETVKNMENSKKILTHTASWMKKNIPKGETIFHSKWGYSPFLICINPKNNYLVALDPIYMYYWSPYLQKIYQNLCRGDEENAYYHLKNTFKTKYGITDISHGFYKLIEDDPRFKILYRNKTNVVFEVEGFYR